MSTITLTFTDGRKIETPARIRGKDILDKLPEQKGTLVAIKVNNKVVSLCRPIRVSSRVQGVYLASKEGAISIKSISLYII